MALKICAKCGIEKDIHLFASKLNSCRKCENERIRNWCIKNKEKRKMIYDKYYWQNKDKCNDRNKKAWQNKIENLSDLYVIGKIKRVANLSTNEIKQYPEIIQVKKLQLKLKRIIDEKQRQIKC